jgi:putative transposase
MPRKPRFFLAGVANHVIQRGNNKDAVFFEEEDYFKYLTILNEAATKQGVKIHAYVLMTNHIHLLATSETTSGISLAMQQTGRFYVPYINYKYKRTGTLWEGRFKSSLVSDELYVLACMRYIEMNPVRAHMVQAPQDYKWSSYHSNVLGVFDPIISEHVSYKGLARSRKKQQEAYKNLFLEHLDEKILSNIRNCAQTGTPLGNNKFKTQIESKLKIKVGYNTRGRPKKI